MLTLHSNIFHGIFIVGFLIPGYGFDTSMVGNIVDEINNKYNTFSLVELIMNDVESYMQLAYKELKDVILNKLKLTTKSPLGLKAASSPSTPMSNNSSNQALNKTSYSVKQTAIHKTPTNHSSTMSRINLSTAHHVLLNISGKHFSHTSISAHNPTDKPSANCQNLDKHGNGTRCTGRHSSVKPQNNMNYSSKSVQSQALGHPNISSNFIDRFLNMKIVNYYKYLHKKYANSSYYGAMKQILDTYFVQFKDEINRIKQNLTSDIKEEIVRIKLNVTNDIKDMKTDLIKLYYETTSTTESVDGIIVHYIENKTYDLEAYVKQALRDMQNKSNANTIAVSTVHMINGTNNGIKRDVLNSKPFKFNANNSNTCKINTHNFPKNKQFIMNGTLFQCTRNFGRTFAAGAPAASAASSASAAPFVSVNSNSAMGLLYRRGPLRRLKDPNMKLRNMRI
uniref:Uncharacterized protein n=1 Tax=Cacopsylla melanoneura TaxID=428564 RepID=A0A8D8TZI1_9HEMI